MIARRSTSRWFVLALGLWLFAGAAWAGEKADEAKSDAKEAPLPSAFGKSLPEGIKDLQTIQAHVKALVKKITPATVGLTVGQAQGSGVIVSKDGFILTAGHVSGKPGRDCKIVMPD